MDRQKIVEDYLVKKERRSLKKIELGSSINHKVFILTIALVGVLPLIPEANKSSFEIKTLFPFLTLNYTLLATIYFGILSSSTQLFKI